MPQANGNEKNAIKKSEDIRREKESKYSYAAIVNWEPQVPRVGWVVHPIRPGKHPEEHGADRAVVAQAAAWASCGAAPGPAWSLAKSAGVRSATV